MTLGGKNLSSWSHATNFPKGKKMRSCVTDASTKPINEAQERYVDPLDTPTFQNHHLENRLC